jgi:hypothetical protein
VLDLMVNAGTNAAPNGLTAQQSYLTFTFQTMQNGRVSTIGAGCTLTNTATNDLTVFDANLQNEICNGPGNCVFRGITVGPGSIGYASGALSNCPEGCPDASFPDPVFRVGQIGICATNAGLAVMHWQFSPPAPPTRDTELVSFSGDLAHNPALFTDYTFCVGAPGSCAATPTAGPTNTNTPVPTNTNTPVPPTNTPTRTNSPTNTPVPPTNTPTRTNSPTNTPVPPTNTPTRTNTPANTPTITPTSGPQPPPDQCVQADHYFVPAATFGTINCDQNTQHCTGQVGSRVRLDLMVHPPQGGDPVGLTAQQAYIDFNNGTNDYLRVKHARVSDLRPTSV